MANGSLIFLSGQDYNQIFIIVVNSISVGPIVERYSIPADSGFPFRKKTWLKDEKYKRIPKTKKIIVKIWLSPIPIIVKFGQGAFPIRVKFGWGPIYEIEIWLLHFS